jgi:hypothetical protein
MLIPQTHLRGIATGEVSLAFRRWRAPTVKAGGTLLTAVGQLAIDAVDVVRVKDITAADAAAAGYPSRQALLDDLKARADGTLYRVRLHLAGPDPRVALREQVPAPTGTVAAADDKGLADLLAQLAGLDRRALRGPWTRGVLQAIATSPQLPAAELARKLTVGKEWLKAHVRKLKALGLTESLGTGYRLSPRGHAALAAMPADAHAGPAAAD